MYSNSELQESTKIFKLTAPFFNAGLLPSSYMIKVFGTVGLAGNVSCYRRRHPTSVFALFISVKMSYAESCVISFCGAALLKLPVAVNYLPGREFYWLQLSTTNFRDSYKTSWVAMCFSSSKNNLPCTYRVHSHCVKDLPYYLTIHLVMYICDQTELYTESMCSVDTISHFC